MARTALITGSTSGIGAGIAEALARAGCNVVLNGLGAGGEIEALRARLAQEHGVDVRYDGADMTRPAEVAAMVERAVAAFGAVDILVNNAGIQHVAAVDEFPVDRWDAILAVNLSSAFHTTRAALPAMKRNGWGRIVNVASAHALVASPFKSAYVAAKHGLAGFTKCVALEVAQAGITVNAICPGYVRTPLVEAQIPDQARTRGIWASRSSTARSGASASGRGCVRRATSSAISTRCGRSTRTSADGGPSARAPSASAISGARRRRRDSPPARGTARPAAPRGGRSPGGRSSRRQAGRRCARTPRRAGRARTSARW